MVEKISADRIEYHLEVKFEDNTVSVWSSGGDLPEVKHAPFRDRIRVQNRPSPHKSCLSGSNNLLESSPQVISKTIHKNFIGTICQGDRTELVNINASLLGIR